MTRGNTARLAGMEGTQGTGLTRAAKHASEANVVGEVAGKTRTSVASGWSSEGVNTNSASSRGRPQLFRPVCSVNKEPAREVHRLPYH